MTARKVSPKPFPSELECALKLIESTANIRDVETIFADRPDLKIELRDAQLDAAIDTSRRYNEPALPRFPLLHRLRRKLWAGPVISLVPTRWRSLAAKLYLRDVPRVPMDPSDRELVIGYFREEIERAAELIGRDLSAWLR